MLSKDCSVKRTDALLIRLFAFHPLIVDRYLLAAFRLASSWRTSRCFSRLSG